MIVHPRKKKVFIYHELVDTRVILQLRGCEFLELTLTVPTLKVLFYQILLDFQNSITFWNVPRLRPFARSTQRNTCSSITLYPNNIYIYIYIHIHTHTHIENVSSCLTENRVHFHYTGQPCNSDKGNNRYLL